MMLTRRMKTYSYHVCRNCDFAYKEHMTACPECGSDSRRTLTLSPRPTEQRKARKKRDAQYNAKAKVAKEQSPVCAYCRKRFAPTELQCDHICGAGNRGSSLENFDTINNCCSECHESGIPTYKKVAAKLCAVLRAVREYRGQNFTTPQDSYIAAAVRRELKLPPTP